MQSSCSEIGSVCCSSPVCSLCISFNSGKPDRVVLFPFLLQEPVVTDNSSSSGLAPSKSYYLFTERCRTIRESYELVFLSSFCRVFSAKPSLSWERYLACCNSWVSVCFLLCFSLLIRSPRILMATRQIAFFNKAGGLFVLCFCLVGWVFLIIYYPI